MMNATAFENSVIGLKENHFLSVKDVDSVDDCIKTALQYKQSPFKDHTLGKGKRIGLIFLNPSLRTRLSTQVAAQNLGMEAVVFNASQDGWQLEFEDGAIMNGNKAEHIKDAAPVLGSYFDIIGVRTFPGLKNRDEDYSELVLNMFVKYCGVPVLSLESSTLHPLQSLTDLITIEEFLPQLQGRKPKVVLTWAPHVKSLPQCVPNSFAQWVNAWDKADFVITHPEGYELDEKYTNGAKIIHNQEEALEGADFVYVKNWSSYHSYGEILSGNENWMITPDRLKNAPEAKVMHCLPVRRNVVISDDILDGNQSIITRQAGNRVWAAQSVLSNMLKKMK